MRKIESNALFHVYIFLWVVYSLNGIVFMPSGIISRLSLLFILIISLYNFISVNSRGKLPSYVKGLNILILVFTFYGVWFIFDPIVILTEAGDKMIHYVYLKTIYMSLLPFYSFYIFSLRGSLNQNNLLKILPVFIVIALIKYINQQYLMQADVDQENYTNNAGYQFVAFLPYVFLLEKRKIIQYLLLFFLIIICFLSAKRGAIIIILLFMGWFFYSRMRYSNSKRGSRLLGTILAIIAVFYIFIYFVLNDAYFASRVVDTLNRDNEELRSVMYAYMLDWFLNNNTIIGFLFGNGPYTSVKIIGLLAHNDWLEIALALGCVGLIAYFFYWISLYNTLRELKKANYYQAYYISVSFLLIYFMKSLFSMSYDTIPVVASMILALVVANPSIDTVLLNKTNKYS